jgi:hypothetical protein
LVNVLELLTGEQKLDLVIEILMELGESDRTYAHLAEVINDIKARRSFIERNELEVLLGSNNKLSQMEIDKILDIPELSGNLKKAADEIDYEEPAAFGMSDEELKYYGVRIKNGTKRKSKPRNKLTK